MRTVSTCHAAPRALGGLLLVSLAACGGGSGSGGVASAPSNVTAASASFGVSGSGALPNASYDATSDTVTVSDSGGALLLAHDASYDTNVPGFELLNDGASSSDNWFLFGQSASKDLEAGVAAVDPDGTGSKTVGGMVARLSDGTIPTSGSATYRGHYAALLQTASSDHNTQAFINGDATLNADFASGAVSGSITNRTIGGSSGSLGADDVTLAGGTIGTNGTFQGTVSGGALRDVGPDATTGGAYKGLFGDNGNEAAGGLQISHTIGGSIAPGSYTETGAFIVSK